MKNIDTTTLVPVPYNKEFNAALKWTIFRGVLSLERVKISEEGAIERLWLYPQKFKNPSNTALPWGTQFGNRKEAISILTELLSLLDVEVTIKKEE